MDVRADWLAPVQEPYARVGALARFAFAAALHAAVIMALLAAPSSQIGGGGADIDAISVDIVPASALRAPSAASEVILTAPPVESATTEQTAAETVAAAAAQPPPTDRQRPPERTETPPEPATRLDPPKSVAAPISEAPAEEPRAAPEPTPPRPEAASAEVAMLAAPVAQELVANRPPVEPERPVTVKADQPAELRPVEDAPRQPARLPDPPPPEPKREREPERAEKPSPPTPPAAAASPPPAAAASGPNAEAAPRAARAAASKGEIRRFGLAVQAALLAVDQSAVRRKLRSLTGTVVLRFALGPDGTLARVELLRSSGRPELDEAALQLLRMARFPAPPQGLTEAERTYDAPVRFR